MSLYHISTQCMPVADVGFPLVPSAMGLGRAFKKYVLASFHVTQNVQLEQQQPMLTHICSDQLLTITVQSDIKYSNQNTAWKLNLDHTLACREGRC
jgi:hypothetical protein